MVPTRSLLTDPPVDDRDSPQGPQLDSRPMPELLLACPTPRDGTAQRYRRPLWRSYGPRENR